MADGIKNKIAEIEAEVRDPTQATCRLHTKRQARCLTALLPIQMAKTQKNKATSSHLGLLKVWPQRTTLFPVMRSQYLCSCGTCRGTSNPVVSNNACKCRPKLPSSKESY